MLRGVIISPDEDLGERLEEALEGVGRVNVLRTVTRYPAPPEMVRMLRAHAPQVVFLGVDSISKALEIVNVVEQNAPGVQVVAMHRVCDPQTLLEVMRGGIREFLSLPFSAPALFETTTRVEEQLERRPPQIEESDLVYCFLPSKPGVGATTIAVNAAMAMSRDSGRRTLLMDLDLTSGMIRFLMQLENQYSLSDAVERSHTLDEHLWPQLVTRVGSLDVLHSGALNPEFRPEVVHLRQVVEFARRNYQAVLCDLSGNLERYCLEVMQECRRILLVVTAEVPSLHLAREKINYLRSIELGDRISLVLNRCQKRSVISVPQVEELLGLPVMMTFANDYQGVHRALTAGKAVDGNSELGKQFAALAQTLLDPKATPAAPEANGRRKFVEYFSLLPARYGQLLDTGKKPS